jgi:tetratricopeptide (TPR) repeat protein
MSVDLTNDFDRDQRFHAIVLSCLEALDSSRKPMREELLARYPEFAAELTKFLDDQERVDGLAVPLRQATQADSANPGAPAGGEFTASRELGDFRLIREVGRGGMGIVYEAEQVSLGRRVALKVLPFAATMDPRHLQRFKNESQAAAQLHHTNIVPVYSVGCERGVHFYAMQFIEGHSLADVIAELRGQAGDAATKPQPSPSPPVEATVDAPAGQVIPPDSANGEVRQTKPIAALSTVRSAKDATYFRAVAELGIQAAEALDFAHEHGIIHRDIKPANLLLDAESRLWVTDFGLAQVQGDSRLTMTGDLVGTLRYMSPEQALAKRVVIDHRTDVYSLGATLYELLTLEPVFGGTDRQELLRQIAFEEPRPLRRRSRAIPAELETIVLKAIEKNPADRYGTAKDFADDLRHFLDDEPIQARRPSLLLRARKWGRRHRAALTVVALCFFVVAVLGGINAVWWLQKRAAAQSEARAALDESTRLLEQERWAEGLSAARRAQAVLAGVWAELGLRENADSLAKDLEMAQRLEEARLRRTAAVKDDRYDAEAGNAAYAEAFQWYGLDVENLDPQEAGERIRARPIRSQLTAALDDWARLRATKQAAGSYRQLAAVAGAVDPDTLRNRLRDCMERPDLQVLEEFFTSSRIDDVLPATAVSMAWLADGSSAAERAIDFLRHVQQHYPADFWVNEVLGRLLHNSRPPRLDEAICYYTAAVALRPQSPGLRHNFGLCLHERGRLDEAIIQYHKAIELKPDYATAHCGLGSALEEKGQVDEAIAEYREAIRVKKDFSEAHFKLGYALTKEGQLDEAISEYREAIRLKKDFFEALANLGIALHDRGRLKDAIDEFREALRIKKDDAATRHNLGCALRDMGALEEARAEFSEAIRIKPDFAEAHNNLGVVLGMMGRLDEAVAELQKTIGIDKDDAVAHKNLGYALSKQGKLAEAIAAYRKAVEIKPAFADAHNDLGNALRDKGQLDQAIKEYREAIRHKKDYLEAHYNLGLVLKDKGRIDEGITEFREALRLKEDYAEVHSFLGYMLEQEGQFVEALVHRRRCHELGSKKPGWRYPSADWVRQAERLVELDVKLLKVLKGELKPADVEERVALARMCQEYKGFYVAAFRFYNEAFVEQPKLAEDLQHQHRYNAACAAAMAGCGQGKDADQTEDKERARLRRQVLDWLHADLAAYREVLEKEPDKALPAVLQRMQHWQSDSDFKGVRGSEALAKLPEAERQEWQKLWAEVDLLRQEATKPAK